MVIIRLRGGRPSNGCVSEPRCETLLSSSADRLCRDRRARCELSCAPPYRLRHASSPRKFTLLLSSTDVDLHLLQRARRWGCASRQASPTALRTASHIGLWAMLLHHLEMQVRSEEHALPAWRVAQSNSFSCSWGAGPQLGQPVMASDGRGRAWLRCVSGSIIHPCHYTTGRTPGITPQSHRAASGPGSALNTRLGDDPETTLRRRVRVEELSEAGEPCSSAIVRKRPNAAAPSRGCDGHPSRRSRPEGR